MRAKIFQPKPERRKSTQANPRNTAESTWPIAPIAAGRLAVIGAIVVLSAVNAPATPAPNGTAIKEAADERKTHVLFMGADIAVRLDKKLYLVRNVKGSNWVVDMDGNRVDRILVKPLDSQAASS